MLTLKKKVQFFLLGEKRLENLPAFMGTWDVLMETLPAFRSLLSLIKLPDKSVCYDIPEESNRQGWSEKENSLFYYMKFIFRVWQF